VVLLAVLHHVDLVFAEEGFTLATGGRFDRFEDAKAFGVRADSVAALEVRAEPWSGRSFWGRNFGAFLCGDCTFPRFPRY
jgi:hypothetical protein